MWGQTGQPWHICAPCPLTVGLLGKREEPWSSVMPRQGRPHTVGGPVLGVRYGHREEGGLAGREAGPACEPVGPAQPGGSFTSWPSPLSNLLHPTPPSRLGQCSESPGHDPTLRTPARPRPSKVSWARGAVRRPWHSAVGTRRAWVPPALGIRSPCLPPMFLGSSVPGSLAVGGGPAARWSYHARVLCATQRCPVPRLPDSSQGSAQ